MSGTLITALLALLLDTGAWIYGGVTYSSKTESFQKIYFISYVAGFIGIVALLIMTLLIKNKDKFDSEYTLPSNFKVTTAIIGMVLISLFPVILFIVK